MKKIIFTVFCATVSFSNSSIAMEKAFVRDSTFDTPASQAAVMTAQSSQFEKQLQNYKNAFGICFNEINPSSPLLNATNFNIRVFSKYLVEIYTNATFLGQWIERKSDFEPYLHHIDYKNKLYDLDIFYNEVRKFLKGYSPHISIHWKDFEFAVEKLFKWLHKHTDIFNQMEVPSVISEDECSIL